MNAVRQLLIAALFVLAPLAAVQGVGALPDPDPSALEEDVCDPTGTFAPDECAELLLGCDPDPGSGTCGDIPVECNPTEESEFAPFECIEILTGVPVPTDCPSPPFVAGGSIPNCTPDATLLDFLCGANPGSFPDCANPAPTECRTAGDFDPTLLLEETCQDALFAGAPLLGDPCPSPPFVAGGMIPDCVPDTALINALCAATSNPAGVFPDCLEDDAPCSTSTPIDCAQFGLSATNLLCDADDDDFPATIQDESFPGCLEGILQDVLENAEDANPAVPGVIDVDLTPQYDCTLPAAPTPCDNSIDEDFGTTQVLFIVPAPLGPALGICEIHIKRAGPGGTDFTRYDRYSDLDDDGVLDVTELGSGRDPLRNEVAPCGGSTLSDLDGDGLSNEDEANDGTDALNPDTDGDGLSDCQETGYVADSPNNGQHNTPPACPAGAKYHTDPLDADSDGDGYSDGDEVSKGSNATDPDSVPGEPAEPPGPLDDSDNDGLSDVEEDKNGNGLVDPGETDPHDADTDGDGASDGAEANGVYAFNGCRANIQNNVNGPVRDNVVIPAYNALQILATLPGVGHTLYIAVTDAVLRNPSQTFLTCSENRTDPTDPDSDDDGLLDGVERGRAATVGLRTDPLHVDTDGDALTDCQEIGYVANSDFGDGVTPGLMTYYLTPLPEVPAPQSYPPVTACPDPDGLGTAYEIDFHFRTNPTSDNEDGDGITARIEHRNRGVVGGYGGTNPTVTDHDGDTINDGQEDYDQDGLFDLIPRAYPTVLSRTTESSPRDTDSDDDGLDDKAENKCSSSSSNSCSDNTQWGESSAQDPDTDGDGILDPDEPNVSSDGDVSFDRQDHESDGDLVDDNVEDANTNGLQDIGETDARNPDTDGDGLLDGGVVFDIVDYLDWFTLCFIGTCTLPGEDLNANGVQDAGETDPLDTDSDDDGSLDGTEVIEIGSDPLDPDTDDDGLSDCRETLGNDLRLIGSASGLGALPIGPIVDEVGPWPTPGAVPPIITTVECPVVPGLTPDVPGSETYNTDPLTADTDGGGTDDGQEVLDGTDPTIPEEFAGEVFDPLSDQCSALAKDDPVGHEPENTNCQEFVEGTVIPAAVAAPIAALNTLRIPDPTVDLRECGFLDVGGWNLPAPIGTYDGFGTMIRPIDLDDPQFVHNGLIVWQDANDQYLLWDGDACHDIGDPGDSDEETGSPGSGENSVFTMHLGNYIVAVANGLTPDTPDVQAIITELEEQAMTEIDDRTSFVDELDPLDVDEDGVTDEPNGQVDIIEARLVVIDPHGSIALPSDLEGVDGAGPEASNPTSDLPEDQDGITLVLRDPVTLQIRAYLSAYAPGGDAPLFIAEVLAPGGFQTVCIGFSGDSPDVFGPTPGRYVGGCGESAPGLVQDEVSGVLALVNDAVAEVLDEDSDGANLLEETQAGSDPSDPDSTPVDTDGDGDLNEADNCPDAPNADQLDTDADGDGDACDDDDDNDGFDDGDDVFPTDPTRAGDGDGDGIDSLEDNCWEDSNPDQADFDADGAGDACDSDDDEDGLDDELEDMLFPFGLGDSKDADVPVPRSIDGDGFVAAFAFPDASGTGTVPVVPVNGALEVQVTPMERDAATGVYAAYEGDLILVMQLNCAVLKPVLENAVSCDEDTESLYNSAEDQVLTADDADEAGVYTFVIPAEVMEAAFEDKAIVCDGPCPLLGVNFFVQDSRSDSATRYSSFSVQTNALVQVDAPAADNLEDSKAGAFTPVWLLNGAVDPQAMVCTNAPEVCAVLPQDADSDGVPDAVDKCAGEDDLDLEGDCSVVTFLQDFLAPWISFFTEEVPDSLDCNKPQISETVGVCMGSRHGGLIGLEIRVGDRTFVF